MQITIRIPRWVLQTRNSTKTHRHQGPRINYPRDKYNQNTQFLGHQQSPTDWSTPMEAELLRTLRMFLQAGSNGWGPARG